tara:strand:- start:1445 stop:2173 length:729 start_codon:yes stop_codon:yes gene_type:complete
VNEVLFRDDHYIAVDKRSGLVVHPTAMARDATALLPIVRKKVGGWVYPVHRLDRGTSGLVLFALSQEAARRMGGLIESRLVDKQYLAVLRGYLEDCRVDHAYDDGEHGGDSVDCVTDFYAEARVELPYAAGRYDTARYSLVRARLLTGRRHQIRRHAAHVSHPVIGDTTHGDGDHNRLFRDVFKLSRLLLMATSMRFEHPFTQESVTIEAPIPSRLQRVFDRFSWPAPTLWKELIQPEVVHA